MTASQAKLSLIPARSPPGPLCQIKHVTAAPVPLSRQKDIWRLKLGNREDDGSFLRSFNNSRLSICIYLPLFSPCLTISPSSCCSLRCVLSSPSIPTLPLALGRCICMDLLLLMLCQKWILCTGGRFKESVVVGGCGAFRTGLRLNIECLLTAEKVRR